MGNGLMSKETIFKKKITGFESNNISVMKTIVKADVDFKSGDSLAIVFKSGEIRASTPAVEASGVWGSDWGNTPSGTYQAPRASVCKIRTRTDGSEVVLVARHLADSSSTSKIYIGLASNVLPYNGRVSPSFSFLVANGAGAGCYILHIERLSNEIALLVYSTDGSNNYVVAIKVDSSYIISKGTAVLLPTPLTGYKVVPAGENVALIAGNYSNSLRGYGVSVNNSTLEVTIGSLTTIIPSIWGINPPITYAFDDSGAILLGFTRTSSPYTGYVACRVSESRVVSYGSAVYNSDGTGSACYQSIVMRIGKYFVGVYSRTSDSKHVIINVSESLVITLGNSSTGNQLPSQLETCWSGDIGLYFYSGGSSGNGAIVSISNGTPVSYLFSTTSKNYTALAMINRNFLLRWYSQNDYDFYRLYIDIFGLRRIIGGFAAKEGITGSLFEADIVNLA